MQNKLIILPMILIFSTLMQIHSIAFWSDVAGVWTGWAWSIALEAAVLWLWYERRLLIIRWLAAIILIAGPWYQLTAPTIEILHHHNSLRIQAADLQDSIDQLSMSVKSYDDNSEDRTGWGGRIDRTQFSLSEERSSLRAVNKEIAALPPAWRSLLTAVVPALVLCIIMMTQITVIKGLQSRHIAPLDIKKPKEEQSKCLKNSESEKAQLAARVAAKIRSAQIESKEHPRQSEIAERLGVRSADITLILNHEKYAKMGKETISLPKLKKMAEALG